MSRRSFLELTIHRLSHSPAKGLGYSTCQFLVVLEAQLLGLSNQGSGYQLLEAVTGGQDRQGVVRDAVKARECRNLHGTIAKAVL
jgi:hypothetical protein